MSRQLACLLACLLAALLQIRSRRLLLTPPHLLLPLPFTSTSKHACVRKMSDAASPFAPLVATIRDLTLQPHSASDATAAAAADFQFAFEKHHPPSLPFDTRATILAQLHACNARVADWFDDAINQQLNSHDKQLLLQCVTNHAHATCNPLCEQSCSVFQSE